jgi:hypothetical protein
MNACAVAANPRNPVWGVGVHLEGCMGSEGHRIFEIRNESFPSTGSQGFVAQTLENRIMLE